MGYEPNAAGYEYARANHGHWPIEIPPAASFHFPVCGPTGRRDLEFYGPHTATHGPRPMPRHMPEEHHASIGVVGKFASWKYKGKSLEGYEIKFEDGTENLPLTDFVPHLL